MVNLFHDIDGLKNFILFSPATASNNRKAYGFKKATKVITAFMCSFLNGPRGATPDPRVHPSGLTLQIKAVIESGFLLNPKASRINFLRRPPRGRKSEKKSLTKKSFMKKRKMRTQKMKPLAQLDDAEKAKLLYQLFPAEFTSLFDYLLLAGEVAEDDLASCKITTADYPAIEFWALAVKMVQKKIQLSRAPNNSIKEQFAVRLFLGLNAKYTIAAIMDLLNSRKPEQAHKRFILFFKVLFEKDL
jgi:hypothetical protein